MKVEIWSDVACPWCQIGKRRFEAALTRFAHRDEVEVEWKAFELDPGAESGAPDELRSEHDYADRLARKYGTTRAGAQEMLDRMTAVAAEEGLDFHFERAVRANTFDAHQLLALARDRGAQAAVKERLLTAYFTEGAAVGDRETLVRLGAEAGLDADEAREALQDQRYAGTVRADEAEAQSLGISGVPFFVIDRRYGVSGAQPADLFLQALNQAWADAHPLTLVAPAAGARDDGEGAACGPDGCR